MKKLLAALAVFAASVSPIAHATPTTQAQFDSLMNEFGVITEYRAVAPAAPLGILGFDLSLEGTSGTYEGSTVVLPKIKFQKGLIAGLDLAGYYTSAPIPGTSVTANGYGAALSYAILEGGIAEPAWNVRGSYTSLDVPGVVNTTTYGIDTSVSKGIGPISPFAGVGLVQLNGTDQTGAGFSSYSATKTRYYYGVSFDMLLMNLALEGDNTGGTNSYSVKLGFRFGG
jgi:hypothetical protein